MSLQDTPQDKNILLVSHEMSYTGAPRSLLNMAAVLEELGYQVEVWTLCQGPLVQEFERAGLQVTGVTFPEEASEQLAEQIARYRFVIANTIFCAAFASYAAHFAETILILREAGNLPQIIRECGLNPADIKEAGHLVCVSEYARECIRQEYGIDAISVIPNFVEDWKGKGRCRMPRGGGDEGTPKCRTIRFMVSGTVEPRKGQDIAVSAFLALPRDLQEKAELHLAGVSPVWAGDYRAAVFSHTCRRVYYHGGIQGRKELMRLYQSMDVMLVTSRDEACSLVALEAAMLGKGLAVTENTGAKYLVSSSCVLPTGDMDALRRKMEEYIRDPDRLRTEGAENRRRYLAYGTKDQYRKKVEAYLCGLPPEKSRRQQIGVRVSVVVPVYNVEKYLRVCLDSLLAQTLPGLEIICVDDGSSDGSTVILEEYAERLRTETGQAEGKNAGGSQAGQHTMRIIRTENHGYGHAVNLGIREAHGEYIGITEPDDYADITMYEKLYHRALATGAEIVKCDFFRFTGENETQCNIRQRTARKESNYNRLICPKKEKESFRFIMNTWCGIYSRAFIEQHDIRHNETPGASYQDNGFWFQGFCFAERITFLPEPLYYNRRDNASSSVNQREKVYCANEEFAYIRRFLAGRPALEREFLYQYSMKKYHTYLFTLERIAWESKREYLERFSEEFSAAEKEGELSKAVFTPQEWGNLHWIMRDPGGYFAEKVEGGVQISVIIPVCNAEKYIAQCLESLVRQQMRRFEVICIDDGSSDSSAQLMEEFVRRDRRFQLCRQANAGAGAARNAGLRMARGKYILFLDADDYFAPQMLLNAWKKIRETESDICVMGSWQYDDRSGETVPCTYSLQLEHYPACDPFRVEQMTYNPFRAFVGWAWDKLYRKDFLQNHCLEFQEQRTSNDMFFTYMSLFKADKITILKERVIYQRRNRPDSLSATREKSWGCFYNALSAMRRELEEMGLYEKNRVYFENYAVHSCLWNLMTLQEDAARKLWEKLKGGWLEELGIADFMETEAEVPEEYKAYRRIFAPDGEGLAQSREIYRRGQESGPYRPEDGRTGHPSGRREERAKHWGRKREKEKAAVREDFADEASYCRYCLEEIRKSKSYRIGLAVTWPVRKLRGKGK